VSKCVLYFCHRVTIQLQLTNISYFISRLRNSNFYLNTPNLSIIIFYILIYVFRGKVIYKRHKYQNGIKTQMGTLTIHKKVSIRIYIL